MFVQIIKGRATDAEALRRRFELWRQQLAEGASGWRGSTAGVTDDGRFLAVVEFESADAARRNSDRPEQGQWWAETEPLLDRAEFTDSTDVHLWYDGADYDAGFVQVMQGRVVDDAAARRLLGPDVQERLRTERPDVTGGLMVLHDGRFTDVVYFRDEASAREGEARAAEAGGNGAGDDFDQAFADVEFYDLRDPWCETRVKASP